MVFQYGKNVQVRRRCCSSYGQPQIFVESGITSAVVTTAGEEEPEPVDCPTSPHIRPPKAHEMRCGSLENKVSGQQSEKDATLQLQANMVLTLTSKVYPINLLAVRDDTSLSAL